MVKFQTKNEDQNETKIKTTVIKAKSSTPVESIKRSHPEMKGIMPQPTRRSSLPIIIPVCSLLVLTGFVRNYMPGSAKLATPFYITTFILMFLLASMWLITSNEGVISRVTLILTRLGSALQSKVQNSGAEQNSIKELSPTSHPLMAEYLLQLFLPRNDRESLIGDLEEEYETVQVRFGKKRADIWYWKQVGDSLYPLFVQLLRRLRTWVIGGGLMWWCNHFAPSIAPQVQQWIERFASR